MLINKHCKRDVIIWHTKYNWNDFVKYIRNCGLGEKYVFGLCQEDLFVNKFLGEEPSDIDYLIPYYAPKEQFTLNEIELIGTLDKNLSQFTVFNNRGYVNYPNNLISGFSNRTYFSLNEDDLIETIENNASVEFNSNESENLKEGVLYSNFSQSFSNPILFSSNLDKIKEGRRPIDLDEIVVSTGLLNSLKTSYSTNDFLFISTATKEINKDAGIYVREYSTLKLKIVGIVEDEDNKIYHDNFWTIDFFCLKNGQDVNGLIPISISFSIDESVDTEKIVTKLKRAFPNYEIVNPMVEINKSVDSLCTAISFFILGISFIALIISIILLCSCTYLHIQDIKNEIALARCIGVNIKESLKFLYGYMIYSGIFSFIVASIECTLINLIIAYMSADILVLPFKFSITFSAYFAMGIGCLLISIFSIYVCKKYIQKIKPIDCLKI